VYSSNKLRTLTDSATCTVGPQAMPATDLGAGLPGKYVPVTCSYAEDGKPPREGAYAFLLDAGIYLPVQVQLNEHQTNTSRYTMVE
jgi:hypothetical protein